MFFNLFVLFGKIDKISKTLDLVFSVCICYCYKEQTGCPAVISIYNATVGGFNKSILSLYFYFDLMKSNQWNIGFFTYTILMLSSSKIPGSSADGVVGLPLKSLMVQVFSGASNQKPALFHSLKSYSMLTAWGNFIHIPRSVQVHCYHILPEVSVVWHVNSTYKPCKNCSKKANFLRSTRSASSTSV